MAKYARISTFDGHLSIETWEIPSVLPNGFETIRNKEFMYT